MLATDSGPYAGLTEVEASRRFIEYVEAAASANTREIMSDPEATREQL